MLKLVYLIEALGVALSLAGSTDQVQDPSHYSVAHPYYHSQFPENPVPISQGNAPTPSHPYASPLNERFGFGSPFALGLGGPPAGAFHEPPPSPGSYAQGDYSSGLPPGRYVSGSSGPMEPPPYGYPDPAFQSQTGFEGLLVPNTWYGLLPWGIEGVIIVIAGIIVFAIIIIAIIGLIAWLCGLKWGIPFVKSEEDAEARSRFGDQWPESFMTKLSANVIDAIEQFNEVMTEDSDETELKKIT